MGNSLYFSIKGGVLTRLDSETEIRPGTVLRFSFEDNWGAGAKLFALFRCGQTGTYYGQAIVNNMCTIPVCMVERAKFFLSVSTGVEETNPVEIRNSVVTGPVTAEELREMMQKLKEAGSAADAVRYSAQELTEEQQEQARTNIGAAAVGEGGGGADVPDNVLTYDTQTLTAEQQAQARENIGAAGIDVKNMAEAASAAAAEAKTVAGEAKTAATAASTAAGEAKTAATAASTAAGEAKSTANTAKTIADAAKVTANAASQTAGEAASTADTANKTAGEAKTAANEAKSTATAANAAANAAASAADEAKAAAAAANITESKTLTDQQKATARANIDALGTAQLPAAVDNALAQAKASGEFDGATGQRGTGLLAVTTAPSSYTTAVGGITPKYRMAISTIKTQAGVTEVLLGDTVRYSYYHYPIAYLDASYAYFTTRVSIRGAEGTPPVKGTDYFTEADKAEMVEDVQNAMDGLPDYWLTHLAAKIPSINTAMEAAGRNKSAFYFYTDAHRISSANKTPAILRYLYHHTSIQKTNSGGDFFEPFATGADNLATMRNYMADMRGVPNHHSVLGNHDEDNEALASDAQLYGFYLAWEESNDIVWGGYHFYYIDNKAENTRYLYLDIGKNLGKSVPMVSNEQMQFVIDSLDSLPEGWHVVPIAHIWYDYEISALPDYVLHLLSVFDAYNGRIAGSVTHNGSAFTYDFAEALGNVEFCIGGHVHADQLYYSNGGIPIIIVDADSTAKKGSAATLGTITEGCVTAVVADYSARKLKMIRIGRGSDRTVTLPVYTPAGPEKIVNILETADIQYNTRWSSSGTKTANGIIIFTIPWADVWNKTIYFKGFTDLTASVGSVSQWSGVSADGATSYGFTGTTNGNIFTSPKIQENNGVYSIKVDAASISASASTFETFKIQLILNSSGTAVSAADLANCIMTIDQPIE